MQTDLQNALLAGSMRKNMNAEVTVIKLMQNARIACSTSARFCLRLGQSVQIPVLVYVSVFRKQTVTCTPASTGFLRRHIKLS